MHTLADFLNHGTLPFVGREAETARITDFWRGTFQATGLRAMLITGEAGVGKSRLLEHAARRVVASGGSMVHAKLYPEATAPFAALLARALWHRDAGGAILGEEPEGKLGPVAAAMRRLARLRPTLLVLEDLHLLGPEALPPLGQLLKTLGDETISLLVLARPVELEARGALEPYLIAEMRLEGLDREECAKVWEEVAGSAIEPEAASALHDVTAGNPLALRSALRGVLGAESRPAGSRRPMQGAHPLARTLKRSVGLLADGMTAHLSPPELNGARRLALLGEVFSREAAAVMLEDAGAIVEALIFKGIVATAIAPPNPLPGPVSAKPPLGFTHTLLHRELIDPSALDPARLGADALVRAIAAEPLYSILPFRLLAEQSWSAAGVDRPMVAAAFDRAIKVQIGIRGSAQWRMTEHTWRTAARLVGARLGAWSAGEWERMMVKLVNHKLNVVRRESEERHEWWLAYLDRLTENAASDELAIGRLHLLTNRDLSRSPGHPEVTRELWEEADRIVSQRPHLRHTFAYTDYVVAACIDAYVNADTPMRRRIERRVEEILRSDELPDAVRRTFERKALPPLLSLFESEEELRQRLARVAEFERTVDPSEMGVWTFCLDLLADVAAVGMLEGAHHNVLPLMRDLGMIDLALHTVARWQSVRGGLTTAFEPLIEAFEEALAELPERRRATPGALRLALPLADAALLRGEPERAMELIGRHGIPPQQLQPLARVALAPYDPMMLAGIEKEEVEDADPIAALVRLMRGEGDVDLDSIATMLARPLLRLSDILGVNVALAAVDRARAAGTLGDIPISLHRAASRALSGALAWLGSPERELFAYMKPLARRASVYLSSREAADWMKRTDTLATAHERSVEAGGDGRLRLSMLGTIEAILPNGEPRRFQGARARMMLAVMAINAMLREPLSTAEFCRIAAGQEVMEIESARDIVKTTVHRIREMIGRDAILTDGGAPRLNPDLVDVDLLRAREHLDRAADAMRRSSPMQAKGALLAALAITRGEVPFPSLYDDFIEAAREDFENDLRARAIEVAGALAREGGMDDAVEVLKRAAEAVPGDEEIAELLHEALLGSGRRTEAERVRRQLELD